MGAETSVLEESVIANEYFQVSDWHLHNGTWKKNLANNSVPNLPFDCGQISVYRKNCSQSMSKRDAEIHENLGKSLKLFRHPGIVKYFASGRKGDCIFVITERITPLSKLLKTFSSSEICAGLHSILQALEFCHDMCSVRHNNFGVDSVFVTGDGTWKIAGFEFLCHKKDYTEEFLQKNRAFRNDRLILPEEKEGQFSHLVNYSHAGDVYAVGLLLRDILEYVLTMEEVPFAKEFLDFLKKVVLSSDPTLRPTVKQLLYSDFFKNDFLDIMTFVKNITLKNDEEKLEFFRCLTKRLLSLPETLVAARLTAPLLARFVLLDQSASLYFLPDFFAPCRSDVCSKEYIEGSRNPILSVPLYKAHVIPTVVCIFEVLDFNIRMILLRHLDAFVDLFDPDVLKSKILPQILLGVKDTNNDLVMSSLHALACIVPILGGDVVIGKNRQHYFTETKVTFSKTLDKDSENYHLSDILDVASPKSPLGVPDNVDVVCRQTPPKVVGDQAPVQIKQQSNSERRISLPMKDDIEEDDQSMTPPDMERSSPDGGEVSDAEARTNEECEWSDWEGVQNEAADPPLDKVTPIEPPSLGNTDRIDGGNPSRRHLGSASRTLGEEFDIMAIPVVRRSGEDDFFADMQPVISSSVVINPDRAMDLADSVCIHKRLSYDTKEEDITAGAGWGDLAWTEEL